MGCDADGRAADPRGWTGSFFYSWWGHLFQDSEFSEKYRVRWHELRENQLSHENVLSIVDALAAEVAEARERNRLRWYRDLQLDEGGCEQEIEELREWLTERLSWVDTAFPKVPVLSHSGRKIQPGFRLTLGGSGGTVYYTLDGSDPRLPGGEISPRARQGYPNDPKPIVSGELGARARALVPQNGKLGLRWTRLDFDDSGWRESPDGVGYDTSIDYRSLIDLDVLNEMYGRYRSVYVRIEFEIKDLAKIENVILRLKYDDAFVAYINGVEIARAHSVRGTPRWNSSAGTNRGDGSALPFEDYRVVDSLEISQGRQERPRHSGAQSATVEQ